MKNGKVTCIMVYSKRETNAFCPNVEKNVFFKKMLVLENGTLTGLIEYTIL